MSNLNPWVGIPVPRPQASIRLFCLPYVGGGAAKYFPWARVLPEYIEVCTVRLPGRESRLSEPSYSSLQLLVDELVDAVISHFDKPFAVFGHSMGALIGFEFLLRLEKEFSVKPICFFASGRRAPHIQDSETPMHKLPDALFIQEIQKRYNGIPVSVLQNADLIQLFLPSLRADVTLLETYEYQGGKLSCPILSFGGQADDRVSKEDLTAWRQATSADFQLKMFPGDHFYLQSQQTPLLATIVSELEKLELRATRV
jgi:medium-chain acyl-[acyl-carrier-protein] hydrolase